MNVPLRRTGVNILGDVPWGSHLCVFFESQGDLFDFVIPYFQAGLESNEFCMWILPPALTPEEAYTALRQRIPDFDRYLADGKMELAPAQEGISKTVISMSRELLRLGRRNCAQRWRKVVTA